MTLFMIGIGLCDEKDISLRGLETVKNCDFVYLESYTSKLCCDVSKLEKFYGKKVVRADRELVEKRAEEMIERARDGEVGFLVVGDPMCATTHVDLKIRALEKGVKVEIIHNASIINAVGEIGLEIYKYGKVTSIPFMNKEVNTPVDVLLMNQKNGLHTLFLLDLEPMNGKFMNIKEAAEYLMNKGVNGELNAVGCARIGAKDRVIRVGSLKEIGSYDYGDAPYCLIIPGRMHFMEEEAFQAWKD